MDFDLNRVEQYERPIRLVFGYLHKINTNAPDLVSFTVLAFFLVPEHFGKYAKREIKLLDDRQTVMKRKNGWQNTTYGKIKVLTKHGGRVRWKLKIDRYRATCIIGIDEGRKNLRDTFWDSSKSTHYAWEGISGFIRGTGHLASRRYYIEDRQWKPFSKPFRSGDIVQIELDMDRSRLRFGINNGKLKTAFKGIKPTEIGYSLAVHLFDRRDSVSIVSTKFGRPISMKQRGSVIVDPFQ